MKFATLSFPLFAAGLSLAPCLSLSAAAPAPELPDYWPTCNSPQPIAPVQALVGSSTYSRSSPVWNGQDFGVAYVDSNTTRLNFVRVYADGTPASTPIPLTSRFTNYAPSLVWNGSGYGVTWTELNLTGTYNQIYFARLNADGTMIGSELKVSVAGGAETSNAYFPALAWSGNGFAVVWQDYRNSGTTGADIYATLLDSVGAIANGGLSHDLVVSNAANDQTYPTIAWSAGGGSYITVWRDLRSGTKYELYGAQISLAGAVGGLGSLVSGISSSYIPALADTGNGLGLVWYDYRDGNSEIYFARLTAAGAKVGSDVRLTNDVNGSQFPRIVWTGGEFGVVWQDNRSGAFDTWFQRVSQAGAAVGGNTQVSFSGNNQYPDLAFGRYGYLITANGYPSPVILQAWGCAYATTPPTCPANFLAYNITGTTASISWLAADDYNYDIAYYQVFRNNVLQGKTSSTYFNDSGLPLSSTNNYAIRAVNAAQYQSPNNCPTIYIKTNASLTLTMNKATTANAGLAWTNANFNNYNVFRGTRPQVMSQIGATPSLSTQDPNVLTDTISYFYSVDNPGP